MRPRWQQAVLALVLLLDAGCGFNSSATFRENYQRTETGRDSFTTLNTLGEFASQDHLGANLDYRASERVVRTDATTVSSDQTLRETRLLNQPSVDLLLSAGTFAWTQGYELQQTLSNPSDGPSNDFRRTDILQKLEWSPIDLPKLSVWLDDRTNKDLRFVDQSDVETVLQIEDEIGPFSYRYRLESESFVDHESGSESDRVQNTFRGTYQDDFFDKALSTTASVFVDDQRITDRSPGTLLTGEVAPIEGLFAIDTSPDIGTLAATPALIDGDENISTGINIGGFASGGGTDRNIGVQVPPDSNVNLVVLTTDQEIEAFFVPQYTFSVWASDDNTFWTRVTSAAPFVYESTFRRFRITIPEIKSRYLKIIDVAAPAAAPAVFVTEMRVFAPTLSGQSDTLRTKSPTENFTGNLAWRPVDTLSLGYDLFLQRAKRTTDEQTTRDEKRIDNGVSATWSPNEAWDVSARASNRDSRDPATIDEVFWLYSGLIDHRPIETLDLAINYTRTERSVNASRDLETESIQQRTAAKLLETLQTELTFERQTQNDFTNQRTIVRDIIASSTFAELSPAWNLTFELRDVFADVTGAGAALVPDPDELIAGILLLYKPSSQLSAETDFEWRDTFAGSGLDQRLRVDWLPFPDGTIDLQFDMSRLVSGETDTRNDRYVGILRWNLNVRAFLEMSYAVQLPKDADRTDSATASFNVQF